MRKFRDSLSSWLLCSILVLGSPGVDASHGHGRSHGHSHGHGHLHQQRGHGTASPNSTTGITHSEAMIKQALAALSEVNKLKIEQPLFNKYEFLSESDLASKGQLAQPLDYTGSSVMNTSQDANAKREEVSPLTSPSSSPSRLPPSKTYTIPPELAEAARIVAEFKPQRPNGNHSEVAERMREKYNLKANDTNRPEKLKRPEGRLATFGDGFEGSEAIPFGLNRVNRRASGYWMVDMAQLGTAPYAATDYKVWRNVKDYGAVGDGTTDDTAAINRAISDGGRCGANCGSSTRTPAVVYFPPGSYLVSSPIIQYYNTQFLGDPHNVPTILAASSFVGLGVITSDVYIDDDQQWYINQNNFLRSIRNFKMDIRLTDPSAYICAIHWQVAQGTSLENIEFYMRYNSDTPGNTQQGIYMENGSGGFLADLTFVGGISVQIHWDWAWTMHDFVIESCTNGLIVAGGAGGGGASTGQGVGSLILADSLIANTVNGIITTLLAENSTAFLLQNVGFFNVQTVIRDDAAQRTLIGGGDELVLENWGFGRIENTTGHGEFINGAPIATMDRKQALLGASYDKMKPSLFSRRRPKYHDVPRANILNARELGARGDGVTDDTSALNAILSGAANTSSVVFIPYGVYMVRDTLKVPIGSRIIGQAWSQIMGVGDKFADELAPRAVVQVGRPGDVGTIEIQDLLFTVRGATAGAVIVEWNAREKTQGSVGLWDTHIRVGGAVGSDLQSENCPKLTGSVNPECKAASMMMHLTPQSSAYMENAWMWVADHDMDKVTQDQIDVYVGRGVLVESDCAWLWGTSSEHAIMYQYQLSGASDILMTMAQTESPYFQPLPKAPSPYQAGLFPDDPTFSDCKTEGCAVSWAVRIIESSAIYILGAGLYSWFDKYDQSCVNTGDCQARAFEVQESSDIWIYNLCTKNIVEMISPIGTTPTYAKDNQNGFLSSILAWLQGANNVSGQRDFPGFQIYLKESLGRMDLPETCQTALSQAILCDPTVEDFVNTGYRGSLDDKAQTDAGYNITDSAPTTAGGRMWAGYNETCLTDPVSGEYCNDLIDDFTIVSTIEDMPDNEICSFCYKERLAVMQRTPYSQYDEVFKRDLEYVYSRCGASGPTEVPLPSLSSPEQTCDDIAAEKSVSSATLYMLNKYRIDSCNATAVLPAGVKLCLPTACESVYALAATDTGCFEVERAHPETMARGDIARFNPWIVGGASCVGLDTAMQVYGRTLCMGPQHGAHGGDVAAIDTTKPKVADGYAYGIAAPPEGADVPEGTTRNCGRWYVVGPASAGDSCTAIVVRHKMPMDLFLAVNAGLGQSVQGCDGRLKTGRAYCVGPNYDWKIKYSDMPGMKEPSTTSSGEDQPAPTS
ncbi:LysM domain-containing protein [Apiospora kogelbergensis]|uniref:LysM domain-containing protein n=1 Tax=Apiospora kogelbergensis TaxID=1337665 RepID=UPI003130EF19